jgi:hypothetical protein
VHFLVLGPDRADRQALAVPVDRLFEDGADGMIAKRLRLSAS